MNKRIIPILLILAMLVATGELDATYYPCDLCNQRQGACFLLEHCLQPWRANRHEPLLLLEHVPLQPSLEAGRRQGFGRRTGWRHVSIYIGVEEQKTGTANPKKQIRNPKMLAGTVPLSSDLLFRISDLGA